jgi:hypothetical protein
MALMESLETQYPCCWACGGSGPFSLPPDRGDVVRGVVNSGFPDIGLVGQYIMLGDTGGEFEVAVGDSAREVRESDESGLDLATKGGASEQRMYLSTG